MSTSDHITRGLEDLQARGVTTWPAAVVAILYKFGLGVAAAIALVVALGYASYLLWGNGIKQAQELAISRKEQIEYMKSANDEKGKMVEITTKALSETADANRKLAGSLDDLTHELRGSRYREIQTPRQ